MKRECNCGGGERGDGIHKLNCPVGQIKQLTFMLMDLKSIEQGSIVVATHTPVEFVRLVQRQTRLAQADAFFNSFIRELQELDPPITWDDAKEFYLSAAAEVDQAQQSG